MAIRFCCEKCSYQLHLDAPTANGVSCPSCRVALHPLAEATGIAVTPLRLVPRDNPLPRFAAIAAAVTVALLVITVAVAWTAFSKQRQRRAIAQVTPVNLPSFAPQPEPPPAAIGPDAEPIENVAPAVPPAEKKAEPVPVPVERIEPPPAPPVEAQPEKPLVNEPPPVRSVATFKRFDKMSEEDLRKQLLLAPEVSLDSVPRTSTQMQNAARNLAKTDTPFQGPATLLSQRPDLQGLPLRMGTDCQVGKEPAENLQVLSRKMRVVMESTMSKDQQVPDPRPDPDKLRAALLDDQKKEWLRPEAVPCLLQLLQAENAPVRLLMVDCLGQIKDKRATQALAMRAMTDLSPDVREAAARHLVDRPGEDYEPLLLAGLRYPWIPVALHAAEALAFLKDREALPQLVKLLDQPDAFEPFTVRQGSKETPVIREVVRINHLSNCLMCHPASFVRTDLVRGAVPTPGQPLPPPSTPSQYYDNGSIFVRADTTYLKQDFSVMQPVTNHGEWPEYQRFDYMVRVRKPTMFEAETLAQRKRDGKWIGSQEAVLFALREITGQNRGRTVQDWQTILGPKQLRSEDFVKVEEHVGTDWKQFAVSAFTMPDTAAEVDAERLKKALLAATPTEQEKLVTQLGDAKGAAYTDALVEAIGHLEGKTQTRARTRLVERLARLANSELRERLHEDNSEMRWAAARAAEQRHAKALIPDLLVLLSDSDGAVIQAARLALVTLTRNDFGPQPEANAGQRKKAAELWNEWWKTQTGS